MTQEYVQKMALETIKEQQAYTEVNSDRDNLLYLMGFNDGVIELTLKLQDNAVTERGVKNESDNHS